MAWVIRVNFQNKISNLDLYNMTQYPLVNTTASHTDITRLRKGQVGGQVCFQILFLTKRKPYINNSFGQFIQNVNYREKMQQ